MKARFEFHSEKEYKEYLKTYFAAMAMQGICASGANDFNTDHVQQIAEIAVKQADALLTALDKTK